MILFIAAFVLLGGIIGFCIGHVIADEKGRKKIYALEDELAKLQAKTGGLEFLKKWKSS